MSVPGESKADKSPAGEKQLLQNFPSAVVCLFLCRGLSILLPRG